MQGVLHYDYPASLRSERIPFDWSLMEKDKGGKVARIRLTAYIHPVVLSCPSLRGNGVGKYIFHDKGRKWENSNKTICALSIGKRELKIPPLCDAISRFEVMCIVNRYLHACGANSFRPGQSRAVIISLTGLGYTKSFAI